MATPWKNNVRSAGRLLVYNDAGAWRGVVDNAITTFNGLSLRVTLESTSDEAAANVVVKLSNGNTGSYTFHDRFYGDVTVTANFDASRAHGKTKIVKDPDRGVVVMAAVFLPQRLQGTSAGVKEIVAIHEFIHAAGMDSDGDHDRTDGVFYAIMEPSGNGLREWGTSNAAMPPVRLGTSTRSTLDGLWGGNAASD